MNTNNNLVSRKLPPRMRPKFEAFKAVLVIVTPQLQPSLHGSNSTKMRIKESPTMIRSSLSQSNTPSKDSTPITILY